MNNQHKAKVAALANQYGRQVFHCANRLLSDTHLAEDVTQEVFLKLFNKAPAAFDSISHWPAYLKSMAISTALDQIRRRKRLAEDNFAQMPAEAEQLSNGPFTQIAVQRDLDAFRLALMQLTAKDAQVFCLRHIEGHSYQEIADLLEISNSLVGVTLHRAQHKLAQFLGETQLSGDSYASTT